MRVADVDAGPEVAGTGDAGGALAVHPGKPEPGGDLVAVDHRAHDAGPGRDGQLARRGEAVVDEVPRVDPDPVAAHLRVRTVGVPVVHEPLGGLPGRLGMVGGAHHAQDAVGAQSPAPVAERGHQSRRERQHAVRVGQDHEVVACAVPLGEVHHGVTMRQSCHRAGRLYRLSHEVRRGRVEPPDAGVTPEPGALPAHEPPGGLHRLRGGVLLRVLPGEVPQHLLVPEGSARGTPVPQPVAASAAPSITPGRVTVNVEPLSGPALTADTVPRWPLTTDFTMKRPRPVPVWLRRTSLPMR